MLGERVKCAKRVDDFPITKVVSNAVVSDYEVFIVSVEVFSTLIKPRYRSLVVSRQVRLSGSFMALRIVLVPKETLGLAQLKIVQCFYI